MTLSSKEEIKKLRKRQAPLGAAMLSPRLLIYLSIAVDKEDVFIDVEGGLEGHSDTLLCFSTLHSTSAMKRN